MKERPILFSAPMVRALLEGRKTQTRRVVKGERASRGMESGWYLKPFGFLNDRQFAKAACPYGQPGDRLWVRETWAPDPPIDDTWASTAWSGCGRTISEIPERFQHARFCNFAADWLHGPITWRPSIHMPRWASRITLEVTGVRVERLQAIWANDADCIAEGIEEMPCRAQNTRLWRNYTPGNGWTGDGFPDRVAHPGNSYRTLWEQINGAGSWDANHWVWCVEFRPVSSNA